MKVNSLKKRFIIFAIIIILPIATSNIISLVFNRKINESYNQMLNKMSITSEVKSGLNTSFFNLNKYILTNSNSCKDLFKTNYVAAIEGVKHLQSDSDIDSNYILRDLFNSLNSYADNGEKTIKLYDKQKGIDFYYDEFINTKEISSYCNTFISKLIDSYINNNNQVYSKLREREGFINKVLIIYIITALLISAFYTFFFLKDILDKLKELVYNSKKVSEGDFTYYEGKKTDMYELDILSEAFSTMIKDIKVHINSLQEHAQLKTKLHEEEMKLLIYQNALKLAQIKVLQSQINPHFLFNTLNCINQTAIKEKAVSTESLIKSVAGILRYSLSMMNRNASLEEEVNVVRQYIYIQESRYEDRIKFNLNINTDLSRIMVPGMTLQPFVENAFIHGIEPKEEGGVINIHISEAEGACLVVIEDDGCGIDEETLNKITTEDSEHTHTGHTTGIGIRSVVKRLELMYEKEDIFKIDSGVGKGTKIYLKIPIKELKIVC